MLKYKKILGIAIAVLTILVVVVVIISLNNSKNDSHDSLVQEYIEKLNGYYNEFVLEETTDEDKIKIITSFNEEIDLIKNRKLESSFTEEDYLKFEEVSSDILAKMNKYFDDLYADILSNIAPEEDYNSYLECRILLISLKDEMANDGLNDSEKVLSLMSSCDTLDNEYLETAKKLARTLYTTRIDEIKTELGNVDTASKTKVNEAITGLKAIKTELTENPLPGELSEVSVEIIESLDNFIFTLNGRLKEFETSSTSNKNSGTGSTNGNGNSTGGNTSSTKTPSNQTESETVKTPTKPVYTSTSQIDTSRPYVEWACNSGGYGILYAYVPDVVLNVQGAGNIMCGDRGVDSSGNPLIGWYFIEEDGNGNLIHNVQYYAYCDGTIAYTSTWSY